MDVTTIYMMYNVLPQEIGGIIITQIIQCFWIGISGGVEFGFIQAAETTSDFVIFVGRFHPLLVHLPIGFLFFAFLLELWQRFGNKKGLGDAIASALFLGGVSAVSAAGTGYLLSQGGGYGEDTLSIHMWLGFGVAFFALIAFVLRYWYYKASLVKHVYSTVMLGLVMCLMAAGHYGGTLTHGSDYLFEYMPNKLRAVAGMPPKQARGIQPIVNLDSARVFEEIIHPILDTRCVSCHNPDKKKGELLLTNFEEVMAGGESGISVKPGSPDSSDLIRRLHLPESDDDHMPPDGKRQLSSDQVDLITWWVEQGAPNQKNVSELKRTAEIEKALQKLTVEGKEFLANTDLPKADSATISTIQKNNIAISKIAENTNFLQVRAANSLVNIDTTHINLLLPIAQHIAWIDFGRKELSKWVIPNISAFKNITRLHLDATNITDTALIHISKLNNLKYLNLYGTEITNRGVEHLKNMKNLKSLYLWKTNVTPEKIKELQDGNPDLYINAGTNKNNLKSSNSTKNSRTEG